jgi:replicative DNA helicase
MSIEIETRVISMLIHLGGANTLRAQESLFILKPCHFRDELTHKLFLTILKCHQLNEPFDVDHVLSIIDPGLFELVVHMAAKAWSLSTLEADIKHLVDEYTRQLIARKLERLAHDFKHEGHPGLACDIATSAAIEIGNLGVVDDNFVFTAEQNAENFLKGVQNNNKLIPTGLKTLDDQLGGGLKESSLITIAGRSGMGKTGFAVHLANKLAFNHPNQHVLFYSLEMTAADIYEKQLTSILGRHPQILDSSTKTRVLAKSLEVPFTIHEKPMASIDYIETTSRITHIKKPLSVIVVDYLGLVQNHNKYLETSILKQADISIRLAALAKELNCIVISLTQVNRDHAKREDKAPVTSDAADSSGSERSSTYWFGIYRPKVDDDYAHDDFVVKCRKNRFGDTFSVTFAFDHANFREVDQTRTYQPLPTKGMNKYKQQRDKDYEI